MSKVVGVAILADSTPIVVLENGEVYVWYNFLEEGEWREIASVPGTLTRPDKEGVPQLGEYFE